jgi:hypothetical protein
MSRLLCHQAHNARPHECVHRAVLQAYTEEAQRRQVGVVTRSQQSSIRRQTHNIPALRLIVRTTMAGNN